MRDIVILLMVFGPIPFVLTHPSRGILLWVFVSLLNPHRFSWGALYSLPVAAIAAAAVFIGLVMSRDEKRPPFGVAQILLILLSLWICVTQAYAFFPEPSWEMVSRVLKIYLMTVVAMCVIVNERQIKELVWVMTLSIAFLSTKGGIFTLLSGGSYRVYGPSVSFIEDNNSFALAALMIVPLLIFLAGQVSNRWAKWGLLLCVPFSVLSSVGSHSRGALLALFAMVLMLFMKSRRKILLLMVVLTALPLLVAFLPAEWFNRMETIQTYDQDASAMGRINSWHMAFNLACDRITGGGFALANTFVFGLYAPNPNIPLAAHSIYFEVLGEHGFIGLFLFLGIGITAWSQAGWVIRHAPAIPEFAWMVSLARMLQVSLAVFAVGGAFLSMTYWDMPYYATVVTVAMKRLLRERMLAVRAADSPAILPKPVPPGLSTASVRC
ncbi:putative O-glycosylation ligase, exosortase A system-associated [Niveibacterium terrae]|uniref:putative O-glycosylation ligase, exosortase A system-associated n=1 Tax=Niveibacterium terrae TaxID=3373598 RepID=UPI003A9064B4